MRKLHDRIMSVTATRLRNSYRCGLVSLILYQKNFLVAEYEWEATSVSLLWTLKDILEYVFWQGALVAVSFVSCIAGKDMNFNLTTSLSHILWC